MPIGPPKIFVSHAWADKDLVTRLEQELQNAGAEVWVDHSGIRSGDNLPKRINDALEWCNILVLVWSDAASHSRWVELEWTNAISLDKKLIPCILDSVPLPSILSHKVRIDFHDFRQGLTQLLNALELVERPKLRPSTDVIKLLLHSGLLDDLSIDDFKKILKERDFFDKNVN